MIGFQLRQGRANCGHKGYIPPWSPLDLFAHGEDGAWYTPADEATIFQTATGETPTTTAGQRIGLLLDKRFGLVRGPERLVNGSFADTSAWTLSAPWSIAGGKLTCVNAGQNISAFQSGAVEAGKKYEISITVDAITSGYLTVSLRNGWASTYLPGPGNHTLFLTAGSSSDLMIVPAVAGTSAVVSHVSCRELPGNHASNSIQSQSPLRKDNPLTVDYDGVDDHLDTAFLTALGSSCTVARSIPGTGAQILTAQTVGTSFSDNVDNCGLIIVNRALTVPEMTGLTSYLNALAGV